MEAFAEALEMLGRMPFQLMTGAATFGLATYTGTVLYRTCYCFHTDCKLVRNEHDLVDKAALGKYIFLNTYPDRKLKAQEKTADVDQDNPSDTRAPEN